jgi:hypothetical protein
MIRLRMRPRFKRVLSISPDQVLRLLSDALESTRVVSGRVYRRSAVFKVPAEVRHFWSPQLHLAVESHDGEAEIVGRFSPHPTVWSFFIALYVAIAFGGTMGVTFGFSQWTLGTNPYALWAGPVAITLAVLVYVAARVGQHLGRDQMNLLFEFLGTTLGTSQGAGP